MSKKFKLSKEQIVTVIGVTLLVVFAVVIGVVAQLLIRQGSPAEDSALSGTVAEPLPAPVTEAQDLRSEGKIEESEQRISEALQNSSTNSDTRYWLYIQQGHGFFDQQNWQAAIEAYINAEAIKNTMETAELLAEAYIAAGDAPKAIEKLKSAITLIPADNPFKGTLKESFELRIRELGGQP